MPPVIPALTAALGFALLGQAACEPAPETTNQNFSWQQSPSDMPSALLGACNFGGVVYAVGGPFSRATLYRWTSRRWLQEATMLEGQRLWSCWAGPNQSILAVGQDGAIFRHNPEGWHQAILPPDARDADFYGVWGLADGSAVAVGGGQASPSATSVILHFDGDTWTRSESSTLTTKTLRGVWGSGPGDLWAVGDNGVIAHFDGEQWRQSPSHVDDSLHGIYGIGPSEVWAVGGIGRGVILRWNGSSWTSFDVRENILRTIWTAPGHPLYVGGDSGTLARYGRGNGLPGRELPEVARRVETAPFPALRINSLIGLGSAMLGAASTMKVDEDTGDWRGAIVSHSRSFAGPIYESPRPDARTPDVDARGSEADATPFAVK